MNLFNTIFHEIKRRKMFKPLAVYASFAFIAIQVTDVVTKRLFFPDWIGTFLIILILLGFPITFFLSWVYDITPDGIEKTGVNTTNSNGASNKNILLPVTGLLTIIGALFWIFYSLSSISHGSNIDKKLFKSIAVLYFDNLSNNRNDDNISAALTQSIITAFSRLELFDVKARTDVVKFKNKIYDHKEIQSKLEVDAYIDGSITKLTDKDQYTANIALVDAISGNNIWAGEFTKESAEILNIPSQLISEISNTIGMEILDEPINPAININQNENVDFNLMGQAINLFDQGNYNESIAIFDSVLQSDPSHKHALYSRGQAFEKKEQYKNAINDYTSLINKDNQLSKLQKIWSSSENIHLRKNTLFSYQYNINILIEEDINNKKINIIALDAITSEVKWMYPYKIPSINASIEDKFLVIRNSSLGNQEASVYIHDILNGGKLIFSKEFSKTYNNETVVISPVNYYHAGWSDNTTEEQYKNFILLHVRHDENYSINIINTETSNVDATLKFSHSEGLLTASSLIIDNTHYILFQKGQQTSFYNLNDNKILWSKTLEKEKTKDFRSGTTKIGVHQNKLIYFNNYNSKLTIENPSSEKIYLEHIFNSPIMNWHRNNNEIIIETKNSLSSIKLYKPFLRQALNWEIKLENNNLFSNVFSHGDNIFALTSENILLCINKKSGQIIYKNNLGVFGKVTFDYIDLESLSPIIITVDNFLIGIDPYNGKTLWKIREYDIDNWDDMIALINNKLFIIKQINQGESGILNIKAYNQNTGELLWQSNETLYTGCGRNCNYSLQNFDNRFIFVKTSHKPNSNILYRDTLYSINLKWSPDQNYIPRDNLYLHLANCYIKSNNINKAEEVLLDIVSEIDQQNDEAYITISNLYLKNDQINKYISSLANYYDLVMHDNTKQMDIEGKMMDHAKLQWIENFEQKNDFYLDNQSNSSVISGRCKQGSGCYLTAHRYTSGIQVWDKNFNMIDHCINIELFNDKIYLIARETLTEQNIIDAGFQLGEKIPVKRVNKPIKQVILDPRSGAIISTFNIESYNTEIFTLWDVYYYNDYTILDLSTNNDKTNTERHIVSLDNYGNIKWIIKRDEDRFLRMKPIKLIKYRELLIIPIEDAIEAVNINNGESIWIYDFTEDIDEIAYLKQNILNEEKIIEILSIDNEVLGLNANQGSFVYIKEFDFDYGISHVLHLDNNNMILYNNSGYIANYSISKNNISLTWSKKTNPFIHIKYQNNNIYTLDSKKPIIKMFSIKDNINQSFSSIWQPDDIFINNKYVGCYNEKKLYLLTQ